MQHSTTTEKKYRKRGGRAGKEALCSWQGEGVPQELPQGQKFTVVSISPFRNQWAWGGCRQSRGRQRPLTPCGPAGERTAREQGRSSPSPPPSERAAERRAPERPAASSGLSIAFSMEITGKGSRRKQYGSESEIETCKTRAPSPPL